MERTLKRSSGYTKLDIVVRAIDTITGKVDYATFDKGIVSWQDGKDIGAGTTREAKIIFEELKNENT